MKRIISILYIIVSGFLFSTQLSAQEQVSQIFKAGINDVGTLANAYLNPAGSGFASALGSNWYNTAATHSVLGFDLTVGLTGSMVPTSDQTFNLNGLSKLTVPGGETQAPTFGGSGPGVKLDLYGTNPINNSKQLITSFTTPKGITKFLGAPNVQLGIGLALGTDVTFRYSPDIKVNGMSVGLWGVGIKHNIKQWIPVVNMLPFDASVMVAYTKFHFDYNFETPLTPDMLVSGSSMQIATPSPAVSYDGQAFGIKADAFMANFIISKSLLFFTPYLGVGVSKTNFSLDFTGNYPILGDPITTPGADFGKLRVINMAGDQLPKISSSEVMPGATVGFRLKFLMVIAMHAQYTIQKYPTASVGFGINFR